MAAAADVSFDVLLGGKVTPQVLKAFKDLEELMKKHARMRPALYPSFVPWFSF
jgi:hypothetical protein